MNMANSTVTNIETANKSNIKSKKKTKLVLGNVLFWLTMVNVIFIFLGFLRLLIPSLSRNFLGTSIYAIQLVFASIYATIFTFGAVWFVDKGLIEFWTYLFKGRSDSVYFDGENFNVVFVLFVFISIAIIACALTGRKYGNTSIARKILLGISIAIFLVIFVICLFSAILDAIGFTFIRD